MIPEIIELKILEYLSIKPMKRCRATNKKKNICQKNAEKGYLICHQHRKILERMSKKNSIQFAAQKILINLLFYKIYIKSCVLNWHSRLEISFFQFYPLKFRGVLIKFYKKLISLFLF